MSQERINELKELHVMSGPEMEKFLASVKTTLQTRSVKHMEWYLKGVPDVVNGYHSVIDELFGFIDGLQAELTKEREANRKMKQYHIDRIEHWKQFRKEFKDGSYSLQESCEIRIDTHQVALKMLDSILEGDEPNA